VRVDVLLDARPGRISLHRLLDVAGRNWLSLQCREDMLMIATASRAGWSRHPLSMPRSLSLIQSVRSFAPFPWRTVSFPVVRSMSRQQMTF